MHRETSPEVEVGPEGQEPRGRDGYLPAPRDTSRITIPPDIAEMTEVLARNAHENWARERLANGWRWGPLRDDGRRQHPCLVPYDELSEEEKTYDRRTALETIRLILALGYRIVRP